jgi:hypothetical protein
MKRLLFLIFTLVAVSAIAVPSSSRATLNGAQQPITTSSGPTGAVNVDQIVHTFTAKETEFRRALNQYSFKRDAVIQTIGLGGQISGEYHRVSRFIFDDSGKRFEKILFFPMPTLTEIGVTPEDLEDLGGIQPFALEASKAYLYNFTYVGKERIDELDLYIFDVAPKVLPDPKKSKERFFQGRIWVDDRDLQIVKARGKGIPEDKNNKYATFETYREQIDGRYWFPTYTYADDELVFPSGQVVRVRMRVRYTDFERFRAKVTVVEEGDPGAEPEPSPTPTKPKP